MLIHRGHTNLDEMRIKDAMVYNDHYGDIIEIELENQRDAIAAGVAEWSKNAFK